MFEQKGVVFHGRSLFRSEKYNKGLITVLPTKLVLQSLLKEFIIRKQNIISINTKWWFFRTLFIFNHNDKAFPQFLAYLGNKKPLERALLAYGFLHPPNKEG